MVIIVVALHLIISHSERKMEEKLSLGLHECILVQCNAFKHMCIKLMQAGGKAAFKKSRTKPMERSRVWEMKLIHFEFIVLLSTLATHMHLQIPKWWFMLTLSFIFSPSFYWLAFFHHWHPLFTERWFHFTNQATVGMHTFASRKVRFILDSE